MSLTELQKIAKKQMEENEILDNLRKINGSLSGFSIASNPYKKEVKKHNYEPCILKNQDYKNIN